MLSYSLHSDQIQCRAELAESWSIFNTHNPHLWDDSMPKGIHNLVDECRYKIIVLSKNKKKQPIQNTFSFALKNKEIQMISHSDKSYPSPSLSEIS